MEGENMGDSACRVRVSPDGSAIEVEKGTLLLDALVKLDVEVNTACGGNGTCGRCAVRVVSGPTPEQRGISAHLSREQQQAGYVLACQTPVLGDLEVTVPAASRLDEGQLLKTSHGVAVEELGPPVRRLHLNLDTPTLVDNVSDLSRLEKGLEEAGLENVRMPLSGVKTLSGVLRDNDFAVDALVGANGSLIDVRSPRTEEQLVGAAVDIGTTTVVAELIELETGRSLWLDGDYNAQSRFGSDVISRIVYCSENEEGPVQLQDAVTKTINGLLKKGLQELNLEPRHLVALVTAGNTAMTHLLLGLPSNQIRLEPYIPVATAPPVVTAGELGLVGHEQSPVYCLPGIASYVGGDITAGVLAVGMDEAAELSLFLDIGTNGEMVLGNADWMLSCACSAGPAFEGVGLECGMRAVRGAVDSVTWTEDGGWDYRTIANEIPRGICGSGLIDLIAALWKSGVIDRQGHMDIEADPERVREGRSGPEFVLVPAAAAREGRELVVTEGDIRNLIRSKAAVFAGINVMLTHVGMSPSDISRVYVAGGFGNYLDIDQAVTIGLLPDLDRESFVFMGNTSLAGARSFLLSAEARERVRDIAAAMTYLELSVGNDFMDEFTKALFLPHTDLKHFPTVEI
jgi:uncharacterized 2Fe-2S/4Fe-4S cluster protein (DUF4445 family)